MATERKRLRVTIQLSPIVYKKVLDESESIGISITALISYVVASYANKSQSEKNRVKGMHQSDLRSVADMLEDDFGDHE